MQTASPHRLCITRLILQTEREISHFLISNRKLKANRIEIPLKQLIAQRINAENPRTVKDLFQIVKQRRPTTSEEEFIQTIKELKERGMLELKQPPLKVNSYSDYVRIQNENTWFYLVVLATVVTILTIYVLPSKYPLIVFRWIIGSIFVLYLPGFVTVQALFPEGKELDNIERLALAIGLSLAITPLIGLLLNYTPWGIRLNPILAALSLFTLSLAATGTYRKYLARLKESKANSS